MDVKGATDSVCKRKSHNSFKPGKENTGEDTSITKLPGTKPRCHRNVLTRMTSSQGPLGVLNKCVQQRIRVKVWTRSYNEVRGFCTGYVVAFDKHWNLALVDVDEVHVDPVARKQAQEKELGKLKKSQQRIRRRKSHQECHSNDALLPPWTPVHKGNFGETMSLVNSSSLDSHIKLQTDISMDRSHKIVKEKQCLQKSQSVLNVPLTIYTARAMNRQKEANKLLKSGKAMSFGSCDTKFGMTAKSAQSTHSSNTESIRLPFEEVVVPTPLSSVVAADPTSLPSTVICQSTTLPSNDVIQSVSTITKSTPLPAGAAVDRDGALASCVTFESLVLSYSDECNDTDVNKTVSKFKTEEPKFEGENITDSSEEDDTVVKVRRYQHPGDRNANECLDAQVEKMKFSEYAKEKAKSERELNTDTSNEESPDMTAKDSKCHSDKIHQELPDNQLKEMRPMQGPVKEPKSDGELSSESSDYDDDIVATENFQNPNDKNNDNDKHFDSKIGIVKPVSGNLDYSKSKAEFLINSSNNVNNLMPVKSLAQHSSCTEDEIEELTMQLAHLKRQLDLLQKEEETSNVKPNKLRNHRKSPSSKYSYRRITKTEISQSLLQTESHANRSTLNVRKQRLLYCSSDQPKHKKLKNKAGKKSRETESRRFNKNKITAYDKSSKPEEEERNSILGDRDLPPIKRSENSARCNEHRDNSNNVENSVSDSRSTEWRRGDCLEQHRSRLYSHQRYANSDESYKHKDNSANTAKCERQLDCPPELRRSRMHSHQRSQSSGRSSKHGSSSRAKDSNAERKRSNSRSSEKSERWPGDSLEQHGSRIHSHQRSQNSGRSIKHGSSSRARYSNAERKRSNSRNSEKSERSSGDSLEQHGSRMRSRQRSQSLGRSIKHGSSRRGKDSNAERKRSNSRSSEKSERWPGDSLEQHRSRMHSRQRSQSLGRSNKHCSSSRAKDSNAERKCSNSRSSEKSERWPGDSLEQHGSRMHSHQRSQSSGRSNKHCSSSRAKDSNAERKCSNSRSSEKSERWPGDSLEQHGSRMHSHQRSQSSGRSNKHGSSSRARYSNAERKRSNSRSSEKSERLPDDSLEQHGSRMHSHQRSQSSGRSNKHGSLSRAKDSNAERKHSNSRSSGKSERWPGNSLEQHECRIHSHLQTQSNGRSKKHSSSVREKDADAERSLYNDRREKREKQYGDSTPCWSQTCVNQRCQGIGQSNEHKPSTRSIGNSEENEHSGSMSELRFGDSLARNYNTLQEADEKPFVKTVTTNKQSASVLPYSVFGSQENLRKRHVNQLFIRGDNVVMINLLDS